MTDELESRLRAADPMKSTEPLPPSWISHLAEETMNQETTSSRRRWLVPAAAAAALVLGVGGYAIVQSTSGGSDSPPVAAAKPLQLKSAQTGVGSSACIIFNAQLLATKSVAFSGTAVRVGNGTTMMTVDHWYHGGSAHSVVITTPKTSQVAVGGAISFVKGQRYLVSADHGVISGCGYTTPWNAKSAGVFAKAFS